MLKSISHHGRRKKVCSSVILVEQKWKENLQSLKKDKCGSGWFLAYTTVCKTRSVCLELVCLLYICFYLHICLAQLSDRGHHRCWTRDLPGYLSSPCQRSWHSALHPCYTEHWSAGLQCVPGHGPTTSLSHFMSHRHEALSQLSTFSISAQTWSGSRAFFKHPSFYMNKDPLSLQGTSFSSEWYILDKNVLKTELFKIFNNKCTKMTW